MAEKTYKIIPILQENALADTQPRVATPDIQLALGLPEQLPDDWRERVLVRLGELLKERRGLRVFMDTCTKCGACTDKCQFFLGSGDPLNMPVARQDLLRSVYRRHFTWAGKWFPKLVGARELDEDWLQALYRYSHQCSECRRCTVFCPKGIDTAEITMASRELLAQVGMGQHYSQEIINKVKTIGNNLGLKRMALADTLESLEEDLLEETGLPIRLPLDDPEASMMLITPSADFFAEPHVDGLLGYAKVLHAAGIRWTLSSHASEAANFALFTGNQHHMKDIAQRMAHAANDLGIQHMVIGECGHAWRVAYSFLADLLGNSLRLNSAHPRAEHICELTWRLWRDRKITFNPEANAGKVVTYHDSCNVARGASMGNAPGGQFTIPRDLLRATCPQYVDMPADTIRQQTYCCGGGGGLLTDDVMPVRVAGSLPRAKALQHVVDHYGVTHMAAICAICKTQFSSVLSEHDLSDVQIVSLHHLVGDAIELSATTPDVRAT